MRHANAGRKFDRDGSSRAAMFKNLVANLFAHERIETTVPKAKELRRVAERFIARAARLGPDVNAETPSSPEAAARRLALKRQIASELPRWRERLVDGEVERIDVVEHLFREIAPRFLTRPGGYTRILKTRNRRGDNAELAYIELGEIATIQGFDDETAAEIQQRATDYLAAIEKANDEERIKLGVDDALYEMELVGHDFFLFHDKETDKPSVVYRRHAFDYGIIRLV